MRAALGVLFLILLFATAALIQDRWQKRTMSERPGLLIQPEVAPDRSTVALERTREGWATLMIGRQSGAEAIVAEPIHEPEPETFEDSEWEEPLPHSEELDEEPFQPEGPARPADYVVTLDPNLTLSEICQEFYGTGAPKVYTRLAEYNGLDDPNAVRQGQKLYLPATLELLLEE